MKNANIVLCKTCTFLKFFILIVFLCSIPVITLHLREKIIVFLNIDYEKFIGFLIPAVFSGILVIFSYIKDYYEKQKNIVSNLINKENEIIKYYNRIIFKTLTNYNNLMNQVDLMIKILMRLKSNRYFDNIINLWEKKITEIIEISNQKEFRDNIKINMKELMIIYDNDECFDPELEYLCSMATVFQEYDELSIDEKAFFMSLKHKLNFSKEEKNTIFGYLGAYSSGNVYKRSCNEYKNAIIDFKESFEYEIRPRKINRRKMHGLLCRLNNQLFHFIESLLYEVFFMESFMDMSEKCFKIYYNKQNKKYKVLDEVIWIEIVHDNMYINKYINKDLMHEYHKILE